MLPIAMILGAILYNPITVLNEKLPHLTQALIFAMLLVPYCRISLRELRIERLHIWLITIQIIGSLAVYGVLLLFDPLIAEGTLICILAPTATAAAVITFMLGGSLTTLATYSLLSNMTVALLSPIIFSFIGIHTDIPFTESFFTICRQMIPLLTQKLHRQHERLTARVKELRAQSLTISSQRMIATRQSEIIRELEERGIPLDELVSPPKIIDK